MFKNLLEKLKKVSKINTESPYYYLGVLAAALLVFSFSFYQAQSNINEPFKIGMARFANVEVEKSDQVDLSDAEELKKLDSDGDGLSDYLELYVYGTSAYIEDTDSDGLGDRIEVVSGADPLCGDPNGCNTDLFDKVPTDLDITIESYGGKDGLITELVKLGYPENEIKDLSTQEISLSMVFGIATTEISSFLLRIYLANSDAPRIVPSPPIVNKTFTLYLSKVCSISSKSCCPREDPKTVPPRV